jgi:hypothetical protein
VHPSRCGRSFFLFLTISNFEACQDFVWIDVSTGFGAKTVSDFFFAWLLEFVDCFLIVSFVVHLRHVSVILIMVLMPGGD